jgi:peptide-methionine (R)-S-oxide reductase
MVKIHKSDDEWRAELSDDEFHVLREAGTERPWTGDLLENTREGIYRCRACGAELFRSDTKFDSHCGWPSFFTAQNNAVTLLEDVSLGMIRTEARCATCDSHLGHVFPDAPQTPTGDRYCINSVSLTFSSEEDLEAEASGKRPFDKGEGFADPATGPYGRIPGDG